MTVTNALILRMAKWSPPMQRQTLEENPETNYGLMVKKCAELSELMESKKKPALAEMIDDLKFLAGLYLQKQKKGADAVEVEAYEMQSI